ncbi:N-acetylneuraminate synthase family protein [Tsuneonella sp. HG249]
MNHNGDLGLAKDLIDAAVAAEADAVKFQTFRTDNLVVPGAEKATYQKRETGTGSQADMLRALELSFEEFAILRDHALGRGVDFLSTAFDSGSLEEVLTLGPKALKWPSGEIENATLLRQAAVSKLPIILSTGMATLEEVAAALHVLEEAKSGPVAILQCVSQYPAPMSEQNLRAIPEMGRRFGRVTGFSDHTDGPWAAIAARALGMAILEKHLTLDHQMPGPDHQASLEPTQFAEMVSALRQVEQALGDGEKRPMPSEVDTRSVARKSLVFTRDLPSGSIIDAADVASMRPGGGLSPMNIDRIIGRRLACDVRRFAQVAVSDVD